MKKTLLMAVTVVAALAVLAGPAAAQYGPDSGITVDTPTTTPGSTVNVLVKGCAPGEAITVTVNGATYTGTAGADGSATIPIKAPTAPGSYTVTSTCGSLVQSTTLTVVGPAAAAPAAAGTLPRTGSDSLPLVQLGAVLIALGGLVVLAARKRATA